MDRLLIHRDQEPSRPIWNWLKKQKYEYLSFGIITTTNLVPSPNVERKTRSLTVDEVNAVERERQSTALTLVVGGVVEGFVPKTEVRRWTLSAILVRQWFSAPKWRGSQNNVQPLVSPWSWDYTLLLPQTQAQNGDALVTLAGWGLKHLHRSRRGCPVLTYLACTNAKQSLWVAHQNGNYYFKETDRNLGGVFENKRLWIEGKSLCVTFVLL